MYQNNFPFKRYQITVDFIKKHIDKNEFILDLGVENPLSKILRDNGFKVDNTGGEDLDIDRTSVLFWNFYAPYGLDVDKLNLDQKNFWAEKLNELVNLMPNLVCIISLGKKSWDGFQSGLSLRWSF